MGFKEDLMGAGMPAEVVQALTSFSSDFSIMANSADGSDTRKAEIGGGGAIDTARGSYAQWFGNEHASTPGRIIMSTGNVAGGHMNIDVTNNSASLFFQRNGVTKLSLRGAEMKMRFEGTMGNSAKNPATDAPADWVEIEIGTTTYYLPAYAAA